MVKKNVRWLVFGIVLAFIAGGGLYWTMRGEDNGGPTTPVQRVLSPEEKPVINSPGTGIPDPIKQEGNRQP